MAAVDSVRAAGANQNIFVVVGHADHFMRDDLSDRENQIEAAAGDQAVHLRRPGVIQLAFGLLVDEFRRNFAECFDIGAPVVDAKQFRRDCTEHSRDLLRLHRGVRAESG